MPYCSNCGRSNPATQIFCASCGARLRQVITNRRLNIILAVFIALAGIAWAAALYSNPSSQPEKANANIVPLVSASTQPTTSKPTATPTPNPNFVPHGDYGPSPREAKPSPTPDTKEITVYITRTGKKYHRGDCQYLRQSKIPISLADARDYYDPCSVCDPPQ